MPLFPTSKAPQPAPKPPVVTVEEDLFSRTDESAYVLRTPARQMRLVFSPKDKEIVVNTYLISIPGKVKQEGETTALYAKANEIMQRVASETGLAVRYLFGTRRPKLALWAASTGQKIFGWTRIDKITEEIEQSTKLMDPDDQFVAEKVYQPQPWREG